MTDDIAQVFRTFMAAMIRINTDLNGHTTNPTIEDHFIGLLRELFEMQRSVCITHSLAHSHSLARSLTHSLNVALHCSV